MAIVRLFGIFLLLLYLLTIVHLLLYPSTLYAVSGLKWLLALTVPTLIIINARIKKQLTFSGCICAWIFGFTLFVHNYVIACTMITFFVTSSKLTKFRKRRKIILEKDYMKNTERNWEQVLCNGGGCVVACLFSIMKYGLRSENPIDLEKHTFYGFYDLAALGCLAGATGDTWASEVGGAIGSAYPRLMTTLKKVPAGTNGAMSFCGTMASIVGGLTIGISYWGFAWIFCSRHAFEISTKFHYIVVCTCTLCGFLASTLDSFLGAVFQYSGYDTRSKCIVQQPGPHIRHVSGQNILSNNSVNFFCTVFSSVIAIYIAQWLHDKDIFFT